MKESSIKAQLLKSVIPLVQGRYTNETVTIKHRDLRGIKTTSPQNDEIDRVWQSRLSDNPSLFDGLQVRLDSWQVDEERLILHTSLTSYREFLGTNLSHPDWTEASLANPIGVSGLVFTSDGYIILGVRSADLGEYSGYIDTIGGNLSPSLHVTNNMIDPFKAFSSEVEEELSIESGQIESGVIVGLWRNVETMRPELVFRTRVYADRMSVGRRGPEHTELVFLSSTPVDIIEFCHLHLAEITPSCKAALSGLIE
jgi:hypothetical protein